MVERPPRRRLEEGERGDSQVRSQKYKYAIKIIKIGSIA